MPETLTAPPPAAPAAAPSPAPAAPPATMPGTPVGEPARKGSSLSDAYSALDKMAGEPTPPARPPSRREKPAETPPPAAEPNPADNGQPKPGEPAAPPAKQPIKAADLRAAYEALKAKHEVAERELVEARTKVVDPDKHPKFLKLTEDLNAAQKRRDELEQEMLYTNYEKSPEYKERYLQPYVDAYGEAQAWVAQLEMTDAATGEIRAGKAEDFDRMMQVFWNDPVGGTRMIHEAFGNQASGVIYHAKEIQKLLSAKNRALEHYRKEGSTREKQRSEAQEKYQGEIRGLFETETKAGVEKYPQWFKPSDTDKDGNELLEKGFRLADLAFGLEVRDENGRPIQLNPQERVKLHAAIRNKAGAFDRMVYQGRKQATRIKELEAELAEYKSSEPGAGERGRAPKAPPKSPWEQVDEELAKRAR